MKAVVDDEAESGSGVAPAHVPALE